MGARDFDKLRREKLMRQNGVEPASGALSKDALRRQADALLAGYTGQVTKIRDGARAIPENMPESERAKVSKQIGSHAVLSFFTKKSKGKPARSAKAAKLAELGTALPPGLVLYCDGCCEPNPGAGGWGFAVYRDGVEIHSACGGDPATTNNIMELMGVLMALRWAAENAVGEEVRLFCDSQYVVNGCNDWRHGWKRNGWNKRSAASPKRAEGEIKNLALWQALDAVLTARPLTIEWCRGHAGIIGNERADELSLMGRERVTGSVSGESDGLAAIRQQLAYTL